MEKIISYLGFANKSNNLLVGQSTIKHTQKQLYLVMVSSQGTQNLIDLAQSVATKNGCECIITKQPLEELTNIRDVKIVAITDEHLAKAIIDNKENINFD